MTLSVENTEGHSEYFFEIQLNGWLSRLWQQQYGEADLSIQHDKNRYISTRYYLLWQE